MADTKVATTTETQRARDVAEAVHAVKMEGLPVSQDTLDDAAAYVAGAIDVDQMVSRARRRHGLTD